ncbi:MAG: DUF4910 domain-containing protein [Succinivibrio sp.]
MISIDELSVLFDRLFPLSRSILGEGYRKSLKILEEYIPFNEIEYRSGQKVLNWEVPKEWIIREGWIKDLCDGRKIINYKDNNLHIVNYSIPVNQILSLDELKKHTFVSESDHSAIPYVISYYKERWGFSMSKDMLNNLQEGSYQAYIDSDFVDGKLVVGETVLPGKSKKEILITSYLCHPSMANNELSGPLTMVLLYDRIKAWKDRKYTYRFVINPETIGSISYLSDHGDYLRKNVFAGIVLTCLGGTQTLRWKKSKRGTSPLDIFIDSLNAESESEVYRIRDFDPSEGSDERQYCSAGFDLPVGQMARLVYGSYKEYHTSNDSKDLMGVDNLIDSCDLIEELLKKFEKEKFYLNKHPYGEIKLSNYDLYPSVNSDGNRFVEKSHDPDLVRIVMTILSYSDGSHSLSYIAKKLNISIERITVAATLLEQLELVEEYL